MKHLALLTLAFTLAACTAADPHAGHDMNSMAGHEMKHLTVHLEEGGEQNDLSFSIHDGNDIFTDFGVSHTKKMHLLIVRDDLQHFRHVHPESDSMGVWHIPFTPDAGGTYWIYADFVDSSGMPYTLRAVREFADEKGPTGIQENFSREKEFDGYPVKLEATRNGAEFNLKFEVLDGEQKPANFEDYLEAKAHSVLLSPEGQFVHTHGLLTSDGRIEVQGKLETNGFVRSFTQFQIDGNVITAVFDLPPSE